jgi:hypothetical protein
VSISVSVPKTTIAVSASGGSVSAAVTASQIQAAASGGIGPQGITTLGSATDVQISSVAEGDVLRYSAAKWRNHAENQLTDGGNF